MNARLLLAAALAAGCARAADLPALVPWPVSFATHASDEVVLPARPVIAVPAANSAGLAAGRRLADLLRRTHGVEAVVGAQGEIRFRHDRTLADEAYRLKVEAPGVVIEASGIAGWTHGASTLWQLASSRGGRLVLPPVEVKDAPRFRWRGLMLDSARHYQSPQFIKSFLEWMALHKLNVLHWHLTDDQAWRIEIRKYPRLTQVGAWRVPAGAPARGDIDAATAKPRRHGGFYSQETVRELVRFAADRGITIVPEIEMPGHATAAIAAYPWLASIGDPPTEVPSDWGVYPNAYSLDDRTFRFVEDVLREVMALFPGRYIHVGGDEVEKTQWSSSPAARARLRELHTSDVARLQVYFTQRVGRFLAANGRRLVGWDEILEPGLPQGAVVMSWRGIDGALAAAARGHDTVLAAHPTLYFDNRQSASPHEPPGRVRVVSLADVYAFDPMPAAIAPERRRHVLGVQGNLWTEHVRTEARAAVMAFPRAAAVAELGWSQPERRDFADFSRRLDGLLTRYPSVGLAEPALLEKVRRAPAIPPAPLRREAHELALCSEHIAIVLEDDAPLHGGRASFPVDIQNPCWLWRGAPLDRANAIEVRVGQVPFNFQIGEDVKKIRFPQAHTPQGELEVRAGGCEGEVVARLPLAPAAFHHGVTALPAATLAASREPRDLCFRFAQPSLDPVWVLHSVQLRGAS